MEKLKVEILSIVNVKIQRLHIQYEDKLTDSEAPYTLGIALGESPPHSFHLPFTFVSPSFCRRKPLLRIILTGLIGGVTMRSSDIHVSLYHPYCPYHPCHSFRPYHPYHLYRPSTASTVPTAPLPGEATFDTNLQAQLRKDKFEDPLLYCDLTLNNLRVYLAKGASKNHVLASFTPFIHIYCRICTYVHPIYIFSHHIYIIYTPNTPLNTLYTPYICPKYTAT